MVKYSKGQKFLIDNMEYVITKVQSRPYRDGLRSLYFLKNSLNNKELLQLEEDLDKREALK